MTLTWGSVVESMDDAEGAEHDGAEHILSASPSVGSRSYGRYGGRSGDAGPGNTKKKGVGGRV
jgi:hypothetical protein